jgi:acetyl-CoA acetyltransferase
VTDVAVIGFAQAPCERHSPATTNGVEMLVPIFHEVFEATGLSKNDIGFWCSGSSDYLAGRAFSFVSAVDAIGAFPPVMESHVEMDGAWALYEAWLKVLTGEAETALAYGFGKSSAGLLRRVLALQLDPYLVAPLWPDSVSIAALQARAGLDAGLWTEADMAAVAARSQRDAARNPKALAGRAPGGQAPPAKAPASAAGETTTEMLSHPYIADPLRAHDCAPVTDGAAVVILAAGDRARALCERPAWITGFEHRIDSAALGARDLTASPSTASAGRAAGASRAQVAELHAPFTHQELILRRELGLGDEVTISPSGGALGGNPMFAAGLARIGSAASEIISGRAEVALGHATGGPALQQNLVCVMDASGSNGRSA